MNVDLFGEPIVEKNDLKSEFIISPFSILDTASGDWQNRKNMWKSLGIKSEIGRGEGGNNIGHTINIGDSSYKILYLQHFLKNPLYHQDENDAKHLLKMSLNHILLHHLMV